jgi:hypothetical protein
MTLFHRSINRPENAMCMPTRRRFSLILILIFASGLVATSASAISVTLEWDANPQPELRGYKIFCRLSTDETYDYEKPVWAGTDGSCEITGLAAGTDYCFVVRAFDADGNESGDSNEVFYPGSQITQPDETESEAEPEEADSEAETDAETMPNTPEPSPMPEEGVNTVLDPLLENTAEPDNGGKSIHSETQWQVFRDDDAESQLCVYDIQTSTALAALQLPPLVLEEATPYSWRSRYLDSSGTAGEWASPQYFTTGVRAEDANVDGILDAQAVDPSADLNADGIADDDQPKLRGIYTVIGEGSVAVDALADDQILAVAGVQSLDPTDEDIEGGSGYDLPLGLVTFKLVLADGASSVSVRLHLSHTPSPDMTLLAYDAVRGWQRMADLAQLADDGKTALLSLTDGGTEDVDGVENGIIIFSGGYGRPVDYHSTDAITAAGRGSAEVMGVASACFIGAAGF